MGFYNSIHSDHIDHAIESYFTDDDGNFNDKEAENLNYQKIHDDYIKDFTDDFKCIKSVKAFKIVAIC